MKRFLVLPFLFFCLWAAARPNVSLSGYVTSRSGQAVDYAVVRVEGVSADLASNDTEEAVFVSFNVTGTTTDEKGFFKLEVPAADTLRLVVSHLNYEEWKRSVPLKGRTQLALNVRLDEGAKSLEGVEITGHHRRESNMESIDPERYRLVPDASGGGIESLLTTFAGVHQTNELSSQYSVRGGSYDENMVYVNGVEVYRPLLVSAAQQEGLSFVNPEMVENIRFAAGGFDAEYGDKMSSVLDIRYKRPQGFEASVSMSLLGASAYVGHGTKRFSQLHGVRYKTSRYLLSSLDTKGEYNPNFIDYQTHLTYQLSPKWDVAFLGNFSQNSYEFIPQERETRFGSLSAAHSFKVYFEGKEQDLFRTAFGSLALNYAPSKDWKLSLLASGFQTNEEETYDIMGQYYLSELVMGADGKAEEGETLGVGTYLEHARNRLKASVVSVQHKGERKTASNHLKWGVSWQRELISDKMREWQMRDSAGYSMPHNKDVLELFYNLHSAQDLTSNRYQGFVQDVHRLATGIGAISLTGGVRVSYWDWNEEWLVSPRVSASWNPENLRNLSFRLAAGVYYQAPFYKELRDTTVVNGIAQVNFDRNIRSSRSYHFIAGSDYFFRMWNRPFKLTSEVFYKYADRLTPYKVNNVKIVYLNDLQSRGYTTGIDLKVFGEFVPGTDSWINFSLMRSREEVTNDALISLSNRYIPRPNEQRYSFSMFFQDYFPNNPKYKMQLKFTWADGLPFGVPNSESARAAFRMPPYRRVDIGLSRVLIDGAKAREARRGIERWVKSAWVSLEVFNLLDVNNVSSYYWVTDVQNRQYAVPNYLTGRQLNLRLSVEF